MKLPNRKQTAAFISNLAEKSLVLLVLVYVIFSVGRSVMKNYAMNQRITALQQKIFEIDQEKIYMDNLITYYRTDTFKELKAREELGYQKPDEHVISVPVEEGDRILADKNSFIAPPPPEELPLPNYQKWYNYFFRS